MRKLMQKAVLLTLVAALAFSFTGFSQAEEVDIGYVNWACATAQSFLVRNVLANELGVTANLIDLEAAIMWMSVATGDLDFLVCAWLPGTHEAYYEETEGDVVDLGPNYKGAMIGLVVPEYVTVDSIPEMNEYASAFNNTIVGIDAGAGIMAATHRAIDEYDLHFTLMESSDAVMSAELATSYQNDEWIVVTGWSPHWKFADFDLKFLEDPKGVYGGEETINTITRLEFADDHPEVQAFLENFFLTPEELGGIIGMMEEYDDRDEAAQAWIEENQDVVDSWFEDEE